MKPSIVFQLSNHETDLPLRYDIDTEGGEHKLVVAIPRFKAVHGEALFLESDFGKRKVYGTYRVFRPIGGVEQHGGQFLSVLMIKEDVVVL